MKKIKLSFLVSFLVTVLLVPAFSIAQTVQVPSRITPATVTNGDSGFNSPTSGSSINSPSRRTPATVVNDGGFNAPNSGGNIVTPARRTPATVTNDGNFNQPNTGNGGNNVTPPSRTTNRPNSPQVTATPDIARIPLVNNGTFTRPVAGGSVNQAVTPPVREIPESANFGGNGNSDNGGFNINPPVINTSGSGTYRDDYIVDNYNYSYNYHNHYYNYWYDYNYRYNPVYTYTYTTTPIYTYYPVDYVYYSTWYTYTPVYTNFYYPVTTYTTVYWW